MTKLYKITNSEGWTHDTCLWGKNVTHTATGNGGELCTSGVIHAYRYLELGIAFNPIHACIKEPRYWIARGGVVADDGTKVGCRSLTTLEEVDASPIPIAALRHWAICLTLDYIRVGDCPPWEKWAQRWLDGSDRSRKAAEAAARAAAAAAEAARGTKFDPRAWTDRVQLLLLQAIGEES